MNLKTIHTKDGRTLYKDLDTGHWVNKNNAEKILSDVREPQKEEQIAKAAEVAKKLNNPEPEYERTPKMDWIEKRIEGKQKELEKLEKKMERIKAAEATNWEKNPYYYGERDLRSTQKDIDKAKADIEKYKQEMEVEVSKAKSRNVPVITDFLNKWEEESVRYFNGQKIAYDAAYGVYRAKNSEYVNWWNHERWKSTPEEIKARDAEYKEYKSEFDKNWRFITQFNDGSGTWEENMKKAVAREKAAKYDDIITRTNDLIGQITDASSLHIGKKGDLNGVIIGKNGRATVETIGAGGYNIQRYHFRTLINKLKEK